MLYQDAHMKALSSRFLPGVPSALSPCVTYVIFVGIYCTGSQGTFVPLSQALCQRQQGAVVSDLVPDLLFRKKERYCRRELRQ